jgi:thiamine pyrophosphate-dependent acetolactate synthase large subunit-like protein
LHASSPIIITSHIGRSKSAVPSLLSLASLLSIPVVNSCPTAVNVPFSHPSYTGVTFLAPGTHWEGLSKADVVLILDSDLPWITKNDRPQEGVKVFIVDGGDPLKVSIGYSHVDAQIICRAEPEVAVSQIETYLRVIGVRSEGENWDPIGINTGGAIESKIRSRRQAMAQAHSAHVAALDKAETVLPFLLPSSTNEGKIFSFTVPNLIGVLRRTMNAATPSHGAKTLILNESISNYPAVWSHLRPEFPGTVITSGGSSLGWALGVAVGASLGGRDTDQQAHELVVVIVGDGSFMFGVPSSAYWMARRYETVSALYSTIVL